jgi:hypothetical protein
MRWDAVARAIRNEALADVTLAGIYGTAIRANASAQDHIVPGLTYQIIADTADEKWEPVIIQWDQWTNSLAELVASERALRFLFDQDLPVEIQGVYMWSEFTEGAELVDDPDRAGFRGRAVRFRYSPIREDLRCGRSSGP